MNRRNKGGTKKLLFEPNASLAQAKPNEDNKPTDEQKDEIKQMAKSLKGMFAPRTFSAPNGFVLGSNGFVLHLPDSLLNSSLVLFSDNSLGFKVGNDIYECDSTYWGDSSIINIENKVLNIDKIDYLLTGYPTQQNYKYEYTFSDY